MMSEWAAYWWILFFFFDSCFNPWKQKKGKLKRATWVTLWKPGIESWTGFWRSFATKGKLLESLKSFWYFVVSVGVILFPLWIPMFINIKRWLLSLMSFGIIAWYVYKKMGLELSIKKIRIRLDRWHLVIFPINLKCAVVELSLEIENGGYHLYIIALMGWYEHCLIWFWIAEKMSLFNLYLIGFSSKPVKWACFSHLVGLLKLHFCWWYCTHLCIYGLQFWGHPDL